MKVPMDGVGSGTVKGLAEAFADVLLDEKGEGAVRSEGRGGGDDVPTSATTDRPQLRMEPESSSHLGRKRRVSPPLIGCKGLEPILLRCGSFGKRKKKIFVDRRPGHRTFLLSVLQRKV